MLRLTCRVVLAQIAFLFVTSMRADTPVSSKVPSSNVGAPVPLELGEVVKGRLGISSESGKCHFWRVSLSPGSYKVLLDVRRPDDKAENIGGSLEWFSLDGVKQEQLLFMNDIDNRFRSISRFSIKENLNLILRYSNDWAVSDYWLGLFRADATVTSPFFVNCPKVEPLKLGQAATALLEGENPLARSSYYTIRLPAGDYKVILEFRRADGKSGNVGGMLQLLGAEGDKEEEMLFVNDLDVSSRKTSKLSLADDATFILRVRADWTKEYAALTVEAWRDQ